MGVIARARKFAGEEVARVRRQKIIPVNSSYLPPRLRPRPEAADFAPPTSLAGRLPVTLYWGMERNVDLDGCLPPGIPHWLGRFDWVVGFEYGWANPDEFPRSVYCEPAYLPGLLSYLESRWPSPPNQDGFVASGAGPDYLLSWHRRRVIRGLQSYFSSIYYEAKDIDLPGVAVMPIGLTEHYVRASSHQVLELVLNLERTQRGSTHAPTVLGAWGAWWPSLDELIPDRARARRFAESSPIVTVQQLGSIEYFSALARFDFMLCPIGNGIQSPKLVEALLMGCIPIATRHPTLVELHKRGMPLLLVDTWNDVSRNLLMSEYPRLFRQTWDFRRQILDLNAWWDFSFPGQLPSDVPWGREGYQM